jgi:hypothetical protein
MVILFISTFTKGNADTETQRKGLNLIINTLIHFSLISKVIWELKGFYTFTP